MRLPRRCAAVFLAAALLLSATCAAQARQTHQFSQWPEEVNFDALTYDLSTAGDLQKQCAAAEALADTAAAGEELVNCYDALAEAYAGWDTQLAVLGVHYYQDAQTYEADYQKGNALATRVDRAFLTAAQALLSAEQSGALRAALGGETVQAYLERAVPTDAQLELNDRDNELITQYWSVMSGDFEGESRSDAAGEIFLQMIPLRNELARSYGYDSFPEYCYDELYQRDYTVAQAAGLHALVKEYIVPAEVNYDAYRYLEMDESALDTYNTAGQEAKLDAVEPYMDEVSSELGDLFRYMRRGNLCDIAFSDAKLDVGFTTGLSAYGSAFFFDKPYGSYFDLKTVIHEFGHFAAFCFAPSASLPVDVAEIHSQGLEMLFLPYAEGLFGENGQAFRAVQLSDLISSITEGCLYDEFQTYAYDHPGLTLEELNSEFLSLAQEYGYPPIPGLGSYWVNISHTFESPMYYLSYATSALSALDLFLRSQEDYEGAVDTYLELISLSDGSGYRATVEAAGLTDLFQEESLSALADALNEYLYTRLYGLGDMAGHWALEEVGALAALGVMEGDGSAFHPDAPMSRAMLVTTLYRLAGEPKPNTRKAVFDDVPTWTWYSNAVAWAYENGLTTGTGGGFDPDGALTRESTAALLYRFAQLQDLETPSGGLTGFSDLSQLSPWAAEAMGWAVGAGILQGADGRLEPTGGASRAETAVMLYRLLTLERPAEAPAA